MLPGGERGMHHQMPDPRTPVRRGALHTAAAFEGSVNPTAKGGSGGGTAPVLCVSPAA